MLAARPRLLLHFRVADNHAPTLHGAAKEASPLPGVGSGPQGRVGGAADASPGPPYCVPPALPLASPTGAALEDEAPVPASPLDEPPLELPLLDELLLEDLPLDELLVDVSPS